MFRSRPFDTLRANGGQRSLRSWVKRLGPNESFDTICSLYSQTRQDERLDLDVISPSDRPIQLSSLFLEASVFPLQRALFEAYW